MGKLSKQLFGAKKQIAQMKAELHAAENAAIHGAVVPARPLPGMYGVNLLKGCSGYHFSQLRYKPCTFSYIPNASSCTFSMRFLRAL